MKDVNILTIAAVSGWLIFVGANKPSSMDKRPIKSKPNIILFSFDTLRGDHLSSYGYLRKTSPHIDEFARDSVLFKNAVSQSPLTAPAHMSLFTALTPAVHKVNNPNDANPDIFNSLNKKIITLAELLKQNGYRTIGMHGGGVVSSELGFNQGFDSYTNDFFFNFQTPYYDPQRELNTIREHIRSSKQKGQPLFLFLHHYLCHDPYVQAPQEFNLRFLEKKVAGLPLNETSLKKDDFGDLNASFWKNVDLSNPEHKKHIISLYDGSIYYADHIFKGVMDILKEENCYRDSIVVMTSDHGEEFYEHGGKLHGRLFTEHLHVPLIIKFPGNRYAGTIIPDPVRSLDLLPALFDYLNLPVDHPIQGVSFLPLLTKKGSYKPVIASYALNWLSPKTADIKVSIRLIKNGFAYSNLEWDGTGEWLFDRVKDPKEQNNLASAEKDIQRTLRDEAQKILKQDEASLSSLNLPDAPSPPPLDQNLKKQLKALGYLQ